MEMIMKSFSSLDLYHNFLGDIYTHTPYSKCLRWYRSQN